MGIEAWNFCVESSTARNTIRLNCVPVTDIALFDFLLGDPFYQQKISAVAISTHYPRLQAP